MELRLVLSAHRGGTSDGDSAFPQVVSFASLKVCALADALRAELASSARSSFTFSVGSLATTVFFSDPSVCAEFSSRFLDMRTNRTDCDSFYVVERGGKTYFWGSSEARLWDKCEIPYDVTAFFADNAVMHDVMIRMNAICIHAAVLNGKKKLIAVVGASSAGKTTTAIACVRRGLALYSDERCILNDGHVVPFPRSVTLRIGGRRALARDALNDDVTLVARLLQMSEEREEFPIRPSQLVTAFVQGERRRLDAVLFLDGFGPNPSLIQVERLEAIPLLLESTLSAEDEFERFARVLHETRDVKFFRLRLGSPDESARLIAQIANE